MSNIGALAYKSPNDFWMAIKKLVQSTTENRNNSNPITTWNEYFKKLLNSKNEPHYGNWNNIPTEIDHAFSRNEIEQSLKECKNKKAASSPIIFEMLKSCSNILAPYLQHLFNKVLESDTYPKLWSTTHIVPIFKAGAQSDPSNYRGIAIGNHISKLFAKCLNKRINFYVQKNGILPDNSLGFRKGIRTEDAIFAFTTLATKYQKLGNRIYTIFVDFAKFYDTIDHEILLGKLYKVGITGRVFNVIKNMYTHVSYRMKLISDGLSGINPSFRFQHWT